MIFKYLLWVCEHIGLINALSLNPFNTAHVPSISRCRKILRIYVLRIFLMGNPNNETDLLSFLCLCFYDFFSNIPLALATIHSVFFIVLFRFCEILRVYNYRLFYRLLYYITRIKKNTNAFR